MDSDTIRRLNEINRQFYEITATNFSQSRNAAWAGWRRLAEEIDFPQTIRVLDVGCGNGRFGVFINEHVEALHYTGIDNNPQLLADAKADLNDEVESLVLNETDIVYDPLPVGQFDLVVLFGVIHHVPSYDHRHDFMARLASKVTEGGHLVFASWCFYEEERFKKRIVAWDDTYDVQRHDYLLDWRRGERALRYCHYVDEDEQNSLIGATELDLVATYRADGKTENLNRYSILRK